MKLILLALFYFIFPIVIIWMCKRWSILKKTGTIVLAYGFGLLIGTAGILPKGSDGYRVALQSEATMKSADLEVLISQGIATESDRFVNSIAGVQDNIYTLALLLSFPLLMFSLDLRRWLKYAKNGFLSVALALIAGIVMVTAGFFIWKSKFPDAWKLAGMFEGIYQTLQHLS
jgi:uncharacterized membrane protein